MKLYREDEVGTMLDELYAFIDDLQKGNKPTKPRVPKGIKITDAKIFKILNSQMCWDEDKEWVLTGYDLEEATRLILSKLKGE